MLALSASLGALCGPKWQVPHKLTSPSRDLSFSPRCPCWQIRHRRIRLVKDLSPSGQPSPGNWSFTCVTRESQYANPLESLTPTEALEARTSLESEALTNTTFTSTSTPSSTGLPKVLQSQEDAVRDSSAEPKVGPGCFVERVPQNKEVYLFYCAETAELARKVAAESDSIVLRTVNWGLFADGFPDLFIMDAHEIRSRHVAFLASFSSPSVIFEQLSIIYALPRMFVASFTLVLPFFPTGTSERIEDEGDIATAFTLARILSNIPISRGGPTSVVIFDIHALQERFYFGDNVLPYFESGIPLLKQELLKLPDVDNVSIAFPDEGAWKRFHKQFHDFPTVICTKVRDGTKRIVQLKEGEPFGRHIVIVDDLVQSGGTLRECQKLLSALGAKRVSAYATHGVFPKRSWATFVHDFGNGPTEGFANFWITDSCPLTVQQVHGRPPFKVLSLSAPIAAALQI